LAPDVVAPAQEPSLPDDNAMDVDKRFINMDVLDGVVMGAQVGVVLLILIIGGY